MDLNVKSAAIKFIIFKFFLNNDDFENILVGVFWET